MRRNVIDNAALNTPITEELANLVPLLIPYRQSFEKVLRRNLPQMKLGTRLLPRSGNINGPMIAMPQVSPYSGWAKPACSRSGA